MPGSIKGKVTEVDSSGSLVTDIQAAQLAESPRDAAVRITVDEHETFGIFGQDHGQPEMTLIAILVEPDGSLRDYDYREVKVSQTIMAHAREVWLAADLSKFKRPAMVEVATLDQIDRLFTDAHPPDPFPALLAEAQVRLTVAAH